MYLFFDTETTGLPANYKAPAEDLNNWPRIVSISWLLQRSADETIATGDYVIKPDGWTIPDHVAIIHGISTQRAAEIGVPITSALGEFDACVEKSETLVAHNMSFDKPIVLAEYLRAGFSNLANDMAQKKTICTKLSSTNYCKIKGPYGYKWPRLVELHQFLFGCEFEGQHNSMDDITATARCFWELRKRGVL